MDDVLKERLKTRLNEMHKTAREVSLAVSKSPDTIRNILRGATRDPKAAVLEKVATELDTSTDWLLGKTDDVSVTAKDLRPADIKAPIVTQMPNDVPVYGTAAGSHLKGAFQMETATVIDYVRRPPALVGAKDTYALYVEGSSMEPRYLPGDLVFVHPHRPARLGDAVIVQVAVGEHQIEASIGFYRRRTPEYVYLGKLNPEAEVRLNRAQVVAIHRVLTINELFGV
ncbi:MAG: LexA family transcriptional regulator [Rhizobiaceae bacterium]